jgi:hypothetical protein
MSYLLKSLAIVAVASLALSGCTEATSLYRAELKPDSEAGGLGSRVVSMPDAIGLDVNDYKFRIKGSDTGPTTIYLVVGQGSEEREYFLDSCRSMDTDEFLPEGLLTPILCDGRRIVLHEEGGSYVVYGAAHSVTVPASRAQARANTANGEASHPLFPPL